jgi:hypothetical protein
MARKRFHAARLAAGHYTLGVSMTSGLPDAVARVSVALEDAQFALVFGSFGTPSYQVAGDADPRLHRAPQVQNGQVQPHPLFLGTGQFAVERAKIEILIQTPSEKRAG